MRDDYDFSAAKPAKDLPHIAKLQTQSSGKTRITIMLDDDVLESFREQALEQGLGYQTLINQALRVAIGHRPLDEDTLRRVIREEMPANYNDQQQ